MKTKLAHVDQEPLNVIAALDELHAAERRANAAKRAYSEDPSDTRWRTFCKAAVEATSARGIVEEATGLRLRRIEGGRFCTVVEDANAS